MKSVGRFAQLFREHGLEAHQITGDDGGLGRPMIDRLSENGWQIRRLNFGSPARLADGFANIGAEIWYEGRTLIEQGKVILPNDKELVAQLTSRKGWPDSKGRLKLEAKEELRGRNLPSPDRAEAVLGALSGMMPGLAPAKFEYQPVRFQHGTDILGGGFRDPETGSSRRTPKDFVW